MKVVNKQSVGQFLFSESMFMGKKDKSGSGVGGAADDDYNSQGSEPPADL